MSGIKARTGVVWSEVAARTLRIGDLIANNATCTKVTVGPAPASNEWPRKAIKRGETRYECGDSFASTGKSSRFVVVGRTAVPS